MDFLLYMFNLILQSAEMFHSIKERSAGTADIEDQKPWKGIIGRCMPIPQFVRPVNEAAVS